MYERLTCELMSRKNILLKSKVMHKWFYCLGIVAILPLFAFQCGKDDMQTVFTGKVEMEGVCGRTVVSITDGNIAGLPSGAYAEDWADPTTGIRYQRVFMIANPCQIKTSLKTGDRIRFRIHPEANLQCITCMAWSPAPEKILPIEVVEKL
jgi:hypothetical protein